MLLFGPSFLSIKMCQSRSQLCLDNSWRCQSRAGAPHQSRGYAMLDIITRYCTQKSKSWTNTIHHFQAKIVWAKNLHKFSVRSRTRVFWFLNWYTCTVTHGTSHRLQDSDPRMPGLFWKILGSQISE